MIFFNSSILTFSLLKEVLLFTIFISLLSIPRTRKAPFDYLKNSNLSSLFLAPVTPDEIEVIIKSLNNKKSIDFYSIPVFLLKILSRHIAKPLAHIVNLLFEVGMFPLKFKVGKVNPLHQKVPVTIHPTTD